MRTKITSKLMVIKKIGLQQIYRKIFLQLNFPHFQKKGIQQNRRLTFLRICENTASRIYSSAGCKLDDPVLKIVVIVLKRHQWAYSYAIASKKLLFAADKYIQSFY